MEMKIWWKWIQIPTNNDRQTQTSRLMFFRQRHVYNGLLARKFTSLVGPFDPIRWHCAMHETLSLQWKSLTHQIQQLQTPPKLPWWHGIFFLSTFMSNTRSLLYELVNVMTTRQKIKRERPQDSLIVPNCCKHFKLELQTSGIKFSLDCDNGWKQVHCFKF